MICHGETKIKPLSAQKRKNQLKAAKCLWSNTEDEVFGYSSAQYNRSFASNIKSPRPLQEPKGKTFTPSKCTFSEKNVY